MAKFVGIVCLECKQELFAKSNSQLMNAARQIGWKVDEEGWTCNDCIKEGGL